MLWFWHWPATKDHMVALSSLPPWGWGGEWKEKSKTWLQLTLNFQHIWHDSTQWWGDFIQATVVYCPSPLSSRFSHWPYGTIKGRASFADHSLTLQLADQLMNGDKGVSISAILLLVHHCGSHWHLLFFNPQQPHNGRILRETRQNGQLFNSFCLQSNYVKKPTDTLLGP